jgi:hypothetical protein
VQRWDKLNQRQRAVLERVAAGDDLSTADGIPLRTCARALQWRRLVDVTRRRGVWRAAITEAGRFYLAHGHHPDHPAHRPRPATPPRAMTAAAPAGAQPPTGAMVLAQRLLDELTAGGGLVRVEQPDPPTRARYRRAIHAAKQHRLVPEGHQLRHTGRDRGDLVIRLFDPGHRQHWDRFRVATRRHLTASEDIITALRQDSTCLAVSPPLLPRALHLVRRLTVAARTRGHTLVANIKDPHPRLLLRMNGAQRLVTISEDHDQVPHTATAAEQHEHRLHPWIPLPAVDRVPNGRLVLQINGGPHTQPHVSKDGKRSRLETRVGRILTQVEAAHDAGHTSTPDPAVTDQLELWHRREAAEQSRWEQAKAAATAQATDLLRTRRFRGAFDTWAAANAIRGFCTALEAAAIRDQAGRHNLAQWVTWARTKADLLDPTTNPALLAGVDFAIEPGPEDIEPFIGQWSATTPHPAYRSEKTRAEYDRVRGYDTTWFHGMRSDPVDAGTGFTRRANGDVPSAMPDGFHIGQRWAAG